jgi:hypothetical protein
MPASMSATGRMEVGTSEMSAENVVTGQASMFVPPTPGATGQTVPEEALPQEGLTSLGDGTRPSQVLFRVGGEPHTWGATGSGEPRGKIPSQCSSSLMTRRRREIGAPSSRGSDLRSAP